MEKQRPPPKHKNNFLKTTFYYLIKGDLLWTTIM